MGEMEERAYVWCMVLRVIKRELADGLGGSDGIGRMGGVGGRYCSRNYFPVRYDTNFHLRNLC